MTKIQPIKLKLYVKSSFSKEVSFATNVGLQLTILDYCDGCMTIAVEPGISINKQAEMVAACFLPGSDLTKPDSIFYGFRELQFKFNGKKISVNKRNATVQEIVNQYWALCG